LVIVAFALVAGCTSTQPGQPSATNKTEPGSTTSSGSPGSTGPDAAAPRVPVPLDDAKLVSDPCSALTVIQLQAIGFTAAAKSSVNGSAVGKVCSWTDDSVGVAGGDIGVAVETTLTHGISDIYSQKNSMAYFNPMSLDGYPAVVADHEDGRTTGSCALNLGVSDTSVLALRYQQSDLGPASCNKVQAVAHAVIATLRGA